VKKLHENLKIPVTCKMRILPNKENTIELAKKIELSGCSVLTVHGRTKE
jgi:tRNA-dihydrouridine synthase 1